MKTTNWQTKALTLFIAGICMLMVSACEHDIAEKPLAKIGTDYSTCGANLEEGEQSMTTTTDDRGERIHEVRLKYDALFWRQPNVHSVSEGIFYDENGKMMEMGGIVIRVSAKVDQSTLPPEDRIPACLEGVPVQIRVKAPYMIDIGGQ